MEKVKIVKFNILLSLCFNSYVYYLTRTFFALARTFSLLARGFEHITSGLELATREFELVTRRLKLLTHRFELVAHGFELVTPNSQLVFYFSTKKCGRFFYFDFKIMFLKFKYFMLTFFSFSFFFRYCFVNVLGMNIDFKNNVPDLENGAPKNNLSIMSERFATNFPNFRI